MFFHPLDELVLHDTLVSCDDGGGETFGVHQVISLASANVEGGLEVFCGENVGIILEKFVIVHIVPVLDKNFVVSHLISMVLTLNKYIGCPLYAKLERKNSPASPMSKKTVTVGIRSCMDEIEKCLLIRYKLFMYGVILAYFMWNCKPRIRRIAKIM